MLKNDMKNDKYAYLIFNLLILAFVIFYKWHGDMTARYSFLPLFSAFQGNFFFDKKLRRINWAVSFALLILILILGYKFDYFKY
jgi:hypothetical protein